MRDARARADSQDDPKSERKSSRRDASEQDAGGREAIHRQNQVSRQDIFERDVAAERARIDRRIAQEPGGIPGAAAEGVSGEAEIDPDSIALVVIRGVPEDAVLSTGTRDDDGSWSISPLDLSSVVVRLASQEPPGGVIEGDLDITGIALTERGDLVAISEKVPLADYVAESVTAAGGAAPAAAPVGAIEPERDDKPAAAPVGAVEPERDEKPAAALEPPMIPLVIDSRAWSDERFDALVIRDVPEGARLSAGAPDSSIGGWVLMPQDLAALAIAPPAGAGAGFSLTLVGISLRSRDGDGARVLAKLPVTVP